MIDVIAAVILAKTYPADENGRTYWSLEVRPVVSARELKQRGVARYYIQTLPDGREQRVVVPNDWRPGRLLPTTGQ